LADGDRVVLLGSTFIEREQSSGYFETALTTRFPGVNVQFRNLGWSGDNVFGEARAGFGTVEEGFKHLRDHLAQLKPTVVLLNYGANESFAGKAGLDGFLAGLNRLLKVVDATGARVVFLTPPPQEDLGPPLPDPKQHNEDLKLYSDAIGKVADQRGAAVVNLNELFSIKNLPRTAPITDNGLHLTPQGYWLATPQFERGLGLEDRTWQVVVDAARKNISARGTQVSQARFGPGEVRFVARDAVLPLCAAPEGIAPGTVAGSPRMLRVFDLPPGEYQLFIDDQPVGTPAEARQWALGMPITAGPEFDQVERLRQEVLVKNELYFHRWRPQNITYLTGFRKHEQGNNAVEIPQFDPLVEAREQAIRSSSLPVEHTYRLARVEE
jgi:lysophospholipase L1-like esterase